MDGSATHNIAETALVAQAAHRAGSSTAGDRIGAAVLEIAGYLARDAVGAGDRRGRIGNPTGTLDAGSRTDGLAGDVGSVVRGPVLRPGVLRCVCGGRSIRPRIFPAVSKAAPSVGGPSLAARSAAVPSEVLESSAAVASVWGANPNRVHAGRSTTRVNPTAAAARMPQPSSKPDQAATKTRPKRSP